jgi:hypothetical protein
MRIMASTSEATRPRFSRWRLLIIAVLTIIAAAAAAFGYALYYGKARYAFLVKTIERGGQVSIDAVRPSRGGLGSSWLPQSLRDKMRRALGDWSGGPDIYSMTLPRDADVTDARKLGMVPELAQLEIESPRFDDAALDALPALLELEAFKFSGDSATVAGLACLAKMPELIRLELAGRGIDDRAVEPILSRPKLEFLNLSRSGIGDAGVRSLLKSGRNLHLTVENRELTSACLDGLEPDDLRTEFLWLPGNRIDDRGLELLYSATAIREINLSGMPHGPRALAALEKNRSLDLLNLGDNSGDVGALVEAVRRNTTLQEVTLRKMPLTVVHLKTLLRSTSLKTLTLWDAVTQEVVDQANRELDQESYSDYKKIQVHWY